jgi:hypothetical protein
MFDLEFSIWIASKTRRSHLTKTIKMQAMPRVGEWIKLKNDVVGDYFAWKITEITHRECGHTEVSTELLNNTDGRGYSFENEDEFDEYFQSYISEGWACELGVSKSTVSGTL